MEVAANASPRSDAPAEAIVVPGLCNVHSHAFQRAMAGLAERRGPTDDSFWTWREVMYRFVDQLGPDELAAVAAQAYMEMLESGFTRVGEFHYLHHDPMGNPYDDPAELAASHVEAARLTGIGLTLLPSFYAHGGFDGHPPTHGQRRFITTPAQFARLMEASAALLASLPASQLGIAPHSLRAVSPSELAEVLRLAPEGPVHMHLAEQQQEVADCLAWSGARPVEWLLDHAEVDARWCLIHATHMTPSERARLAATGAVAGLCPLTEASLGDGIFDARGWFGDAGAIAIGTDSNICIDAAQELRALETAQRLLLRARNVLAMHADASTGRRIFEAAVAGGAHALGVRGGIAVGAPADLVALDADDAALVGRSDDAWLDAWIFAARRPPVRAVWSAGTLVVGPHGHHRREEIGARYRRVVRRIQLA